MAYTKEIKYPSNKKPGVYTSGSIKQLGFNTDELEKISLGNWESIKRNNRVFLTEQFIKWNADEEPVDSPIPTVTDEELILTRTPIYLLSPFTPLGDYITDEGPGLDSIPEDAYN